MQFVRGLTAARMRYPALRRTRFLTGTYEPDRELKDVTWISAAGTEIGDEDWKDDTLRTFGMLMGGDASAEATGSDHGAPLLLMFNAHHENVAFVIPIAGKGDEWTMVFDTARPDVHDERSLRSGKPLEMTAYSFVMLVSNSQKANAAAPG